MEADKVETVIAALRTLEFDEVGAILAAMELEEDTAVASLAEGKRKRRMLLQIEDSIEEVTEGEKIATIKNSIIPAMPAQVLEQLLQELEAEDDEQQVAVVDNNETILPVNRLTAVNTSTPRTEAIPTDREVKMEMSSINADKVDRMTETITILKHLGLDNLNKTLRRELKISGTIGGASKDSLNWMGILSQVNDARAKNYSDREIIGALKKATPAGTPTRTYLEAKSERPLNVILKFIRQYLKEKDPSELLQEMSACYQLDSEDALTFIIRIIEMREKLYIMAKEDGDISAAHIDNVYARTIITGLTNMSVKYRIEALLRAQVDDDIVIKEVNAVTSEESERKMKKLSSKSAKLKVAASQVNGESSELETVMAPLLASMKSMAEDLKTLQKEVSEVKERPTTFKRYARGCTDCRQKGEGQTCRHCWRCGKNDHLAAKCPSRNRSATDTNATAAASNENRL